MPERPYAGIFSPIPALFFIIVAIVVIVSFSFFGTYSAIGAFERKKDTVAVRAVNGSKIMRSEIEQLAHLLAAEPLKTSVLLHDLLKTGLGKQAANRFASELKADWEAKLEKARRYRFYLHPAMSALSSRAIWSQFAPGVVDEVEKIQKMEEAGAEFFASWANLYCMQAQMPSEFIRRILLYQESQGRLPHDPRIDAEDFALFGCRTPQDWFGRDFLDLMAEVVLNGAALALDEGFSVESNEVWSDFCQRFCAKEESPEYRLRHLGLCKRDAIALWKRALCFLNYLKEIGDAVLVDALPYRQFRDFSKEISTIDLYRIPRELECKSTEDFLRFEIYSRLACEKPSDPLGLPERLLPCEEVAAKAPELVKTKYQIRYARVDLGKLAARLGIKEVWDWQIQDAHWAELQKTFSQLANRDGDRFAALESLDPARRKEIDDWSRRRIVAERPDWIEQACQTASFQEAEVGVFLKNHRIDGLEVKQSAEFAKALEEAACSQEGVKTYREEGTDSIWRLAEVKKIAGPIVVDFAEAKGLIEVDRFLKERAAAVGMKPEDGREALARAIFEDLFQAIDLAQAEGDWTPGTGSLQFYAEHRFDSPMRQALELCRAGSEPKLGFWNLQPLEQKIARESAQGWVGQLAFLLQVGEWSSIGADGGRAPSFFRIKDRAVEDGAILQEMEAGKAPLAAEARARFVDYLMEMAIEQGSIVLPLKSN